MIQSPRGLINVAAQSDFPLQVTENYMNQELDNTHTSSLHLNNTEIDNQMVWSNLIHNKSINHTPIVIFGYASYHGAVSKNSIRSKPVLGFSSDTPEDWKH